jgi:hypothetical protein
MARAQIYRAQCGHEGCKELALYEYFRRDESIALQKRYGNGQYRCVRHSRPDEVLSTDNTMRVTVLQIFEERSGRYWGQTKAGSGFVHGDGYKAFAEDFPPGTTLRITAEVIPPGERQ